MHLLYRRCRPTRERELTDVSPIVAGKVRAAFAAISAGNWEQMIDGMAPELSYRFCGEHALSGERHTTEALRRWWERSTRLLPNPTFTVQEVVVSGWPWSTTIATRVQVSAALPAGERYDNVFMQFMHMRWAKITDIWTLEDTVVLQRTLDVLAAAGISEAHDPTRSSSKNCSTACSARAPGRSSHASSRIWRPTAVTPPPWYAPRSRSS